MISDAMFWGVTVLLGIGTFLIRFSFMGFLGNRRMPEWLMLHLRYVAVGVFPALITPLVLWPDATGGQIDAAHLLGAAAAVAAGLWFSVAGAIFAGMGTLYAVQYLQSAF